MSITERIDAARRDFLHQFGPMEPYAIVLSKPQWEAVQESKLALSRLSRDRGRSYDVQKYAGLSVMLFLPQPTGGAVGPMVIDEICAKRLVDNQIAGLA